MGVSILLGFELKVINS